MSAYLVATYNISNQEEYAKYNPGLLPIIVQTITKHGGEILVAGHDCVRLSGDEQDVKILLKFPSSEAAQAWHDDPEYAEAKTIRLGSTTNINSFIIDQFVPPSE